MTSKNVTVIKATYLKFLEEVKAKITSARITAYRKLNKELIKLYWDIISNNLLEKGLEKSSEG